MAASQDAGTPRSRLTRAIDPFLGLAVFFLLFFALGQRSLSGSEDRWGEIARNMLLYGDGFHPIINNEVYFDKPLLSYWLIVLSSLVTNGLNEWAIRIPGALSALLTLFCTFRIATEWLDRRTAWVSVCLSVTSYGFLFWSHTASAELSNLALITSAVAWFVHRRERTDFQSYLGFYVLCAVGCQLKGLTALAVPLVVAFPYITRHRAWRKHVNVAHAFALLISLCIFFLPYLGASWHPLPAGVEAQHNHLSGLDLVIRENIVRFFEPFDHVAPFYSYVYEVPRILFPWMFVFLAALFHFSSRYKKLDESRRWMLEAIALVFLFFTLSGSRRWYYILPIMPYCMILASAYLLEDGQVKWRKLAMQLTGAVVTVAALLLAGVPLAVRAYSATLAVPGEFIVGSTLIVVGGVILLGLWRHRPTSLHRLTHMHASVPAAVPALLLAAALEMSVLFGFVLPGADHYRQVKPFALSLSLRLTPADQVGFFRATNTVLAYYLNAQHPIPVVHSRNDLGNTTAEWIVITEKADLERFFLAFPDARAKSPVLSEQQIGGGKLIDNSGLVAYRLN